MLSLCVLCVLCGEFLSAEAHAQLAVRGGVVYTMAALPITDGVVLIEDGKIKQVGPAASVAVPEGWKVLEAAIVTPGLIDARTTVGLSGIYNIPHDQDQLERSGPVQPELRAIDAYNPLEELVEWVRSFGVTTIHTGHAPGELISGQTMIVKTAGNTVEEALLVEAATIAATLGPGAQRRGDSPGTRGKQMAMLRAQLIKAQEYLDKQQRDEIDETPDEEEEIDDEEDREEGKPRSAPSRDLRLEALGRVLQRELPLLITAQRAQDIASALRIAREFDIQIILDGGSEAYLLMDEIREAGVPVFIHPAMARATGEMENKSFETAARLFYSGIPVAMQSGYESYVPKTRVVLFEAAVAAAHGLSFDDALATMTVIPATILGIIDRVGTLEPGKDADLALYSGDPFEYTTHCIGVIINGNIVSETPR